MFWERYARQRYSRRRALQAGGAAAAGVAAIALGGCSGGNSGTSSEPTRASDPTKPDVVNEAGPPRHGGVLVTANAADFGTFDPHLGIAVASAYFPRVYNVLVNQSSSKPEFIFHDLAESYEIPDETTFVFKIRPGVKIAPNSMGVPERDLDAEDARVSIERIKTETQATNHAFARDHISSMSVSGSNLTIKTPGPYAWFLNRIGLFLNPIVPRELLVGDLTRLAQHAAGAGPYRLTNVEEGDRATFDRNPNYYRKDENTGDQLPYVDGLDVRVIFDKSTQRAAFLSGQIHAMMTGDSKEARSLPDSVLVRDPAFTFNAFTMNTDRPPFNDPRVRRAVARAIDRSVYVQRVYDGDARPDGIVHWSLGSYALSEDELATLQPYAPDEAKQLVDAVGGITLKMMYPANTPILEHDRHVPIFIEQMRQVGIAVDEDPQVFTAWVTNIREIKYDCTLNLNQLYETPEIPLGIHTRNGPFGDGTYLRGLGDAEIEAAVSAASTELDGARRIDLVHEAQRVIYRKDPVSMPLVTPYVNFAWRKNVKNIPAGIGTSAFLINTFWIDG